MKVHVQIELIPEGPVQNGMCTGILGQLEELQGSSDCDHRLLGRPEASKFARQYRNKKLKEDSGRFGMCDTDSRSLQSTSRVKELHRAHVHILTKA